MPEVFVDDRNFETYKQCEIRSPSPRGYYFDIVWIEQKLAKKTNALTDKTGRRWTVHEVYGTKRMPGSRESFKAANEPCKKEG